MHPDLLSPNSVCLELLAVPDEHPEPAGQLMAQQRPCILPQRWPLVAADARLLGLRQAAKQWGVSHETVRQITRRVAISDGTPQAG